MSPALRPQILREGDSWDKTFPPSPPMPPASSLAIWARQRLRLRTSLIRCLNMPPRPRKVVAKLLGRERGRKCIVERLSIGNGAGAEIPAVLVLPVTEGKVPAVVYCHWHGGDYHTGKEEIFEHRHTPEAPGPALASRGFAVLSIDAYGFGERNGSGPGGSAECGSAGELSLSKFFLWAGSSLWAMMLRDDLISLDYLAGRPEIDRHRIGVMGMSMGATRAWWLMALTDALAGGVSVCCLTRYRDLLHARGLAEHGIYYYAPGLAARFEAEHIISLVAPRPVLFLNGTRDGTSPASGIHTVNRAVRKIYRLYGREAQYESRIYSGQGHEYTPDMWQRTLNWLVGHLHREPAPP